MTNQIANFVVIDKSHYDALVSENKEYQEVNEHLRDKIAALELKYSATCKQLGTMSTDYRYLENVLIEERKEYDAVCLRLTKADEENKTIKRQCTEALIAETDNCVAAMDIMRDEHEKREQELHATIEFWQTLHTQAVDKLYDIAGLVDNVDPLQGVLKLICERDETRSLYDVYKAAIEDIAQMVGNKNAIDGVYQLLNRLTQLETGVDQEYASTLIETTKGLAAERDSLYKRLFEIALERDSLLKQNRDLDERNKSLSRSCEHLQDVKGDLKQQLADKDKHIQCLRDELDALRTACVTTTVDYIYAYENVLNELRAKCEKLENDLEARNTFDEIYRRDAYDYESKIAELETTIRTLSGMVQ